MGGGYKPLPRAAGAPRNAEGARENVAKSRRGKTWEAAGERGRPKGIVEGGETGRVGVERGGWEAARERGDWRDAGREETGVDARREEA